jgi:hypothetical protein
MVPAALDAAAMMVIWTGLSGWSSRVAIRQPAQGRRRTLEGRRRVQQVPTKRHVANDNTTVPFNAA